MNCSFSNLHQWLCLIVLGALLTACNTTKYVAEDELLYTGAEIEFTEDSKIRKRKTLTSELQSLTQPKTNSGLQLGIYNTFHNPDKTGGIGNWISDRLGQEPVLFQLPQANRSHLLMEDYLQDNGYFNSGVAFDTLIQDKTVQAVYNVNSDGQYEIRNIYLLKDSTMLDSLIRANQRKAELETGQAYRISELDAERTRLEQLARDRGYFRFNKDFLYFFADTTVGNLQTDLYLRIKPPTDSTQHEPYYIDEVYVYPTYNLDKNTGNFVTDTIQYEDLQIIQNYDFVKPATLDRAIAQERGDLFNESFQQQTVNHLLDLGIFKFVNMKFETFTENDTNWVRRYVYLTPALTQDVSAEIEVNTEATNSLGSALSVTYASRNLFKGAESFNATLSGGIETQLQRRDSSFARSNSFINTLELTAQADLILPRYIDPFNWVKTLSSFYVPKTRISIANNFQRRTTFFTINSFRFEYAYDWQETRYRHHTLTPFNINQVNLLNTSDEFEKILAANPRLQAGFNNTLIAGLKYQYTFSNQEINTLNNYTFFRGGVETSGNLTNLLINATGGQDERPYRILGTPLAQYVRFDTEVRHNILNPSNSFVTRLLVGVGIPYSNSSVMPYIKQFFVGGANSLRAFQLRSVGPGSTPIDANSTDNGQLFDRTGDIRLEANVEYRFDIIPYVEGAVFADIGNIWLLRDRDNDDRIPEAEFNFDRFYKELAVGTGIGLRFDFTFVLLRLDAAIPLRNPNLPGGPDWTFDRITPLSNSVTYNLAIGYPF